jgi:penicillin-binding protein 1A
VKQGKRQPGSTFKPIVYAAAIDHLGFKPCDQELDSPITIGNWTARNYTRSYTDSMLTIRLALGQSLNTIPARLINKMGATTVVDYAKRLGITSPLKAFPSICLGTEALTVYELLGAYCAFANSGVWTKPIYITRIEDRHGNVVQEFATQTKEVMSEENAYLMAHMLKGGMEEPGGSARALYNYKVAQGNEIGAKTGTTQNYSDGWFVGITQELASAVWFGGDDMSIHFRDGNGAGSRTALPIWAKYMEKVYEDERVGIKKGKFKRPRTLSIALDCNLYQQAKARVDSSQYVAPKADSTLKNEGFLLE